MGIRTSVFGTETERALSLNEIEDDNKETISTKIKIEVGNTILVLSDSGAYS